MYSRRSSDFIPDNITKKVKPLHWQEMELSTSQPAGFRNRYAIIGIIKV